MGGLLASTGTANAATPAAAPQLAAAAAVTPVVAQDSFGRTVSGGWGSADLGGAYQLGPDATQFKVGSGAGAFPTIQPGKAATALLPSVSLLDSDVQSTFALPSVAEAGVYFAVAARSQGDGSQYRGRVTVTAGGQTNVSFSRTKGAVETYLGSAALPLTVADNQKVAVRMQVTGTDPVSLAIRAWPDGGTEPGWQKSVSDTSSERISAAGSVGLWAYVSTTGTASGVNISKLVATDLAAGSTPAPTPTPTTTTTAPDTSPTTPASSLSDAGASPIGSAQYAVPSGAVFVSTTGSDSASGTYAAPLRNVATAISKAGSGQTIVLRGGTYHETLMIPSNKKLTVQAYPGEAVWLDGSSKVGTWTKSGSGWVASGWTTKLDSSPTYSRGAPDGTTANWQFVNPAYPMAAHPDQVFINGTAQRQVASAGQVTAGTFYVDYGSGRIYLGSDPTGKEVRASDLVTALTVDGAGSIVRGIGIRRYSPSVPDMGAVRISNSGVTLENVSIEDSATTGISVYHPNVTLRKVSVLRSGMLNIQGNQADNFTMDRVRSEYGNAEQFNMAPVSGGLKITQSRTTTVTGSVFSNNRGPGLWFDQSAYDMKVLNSNVQGNLSHGIQMEISGKFLIANCLITNNAKIGILPRNTNDGRIWNITIVGNADSNINILQDTRLPTNTSYGQDKRQPFPDPTMTWLVTNIEIKNNVNTIPTASAAVALFLRDQDGRSAEAMGPNIDGNFYNRINAASPKNEIGWSKSGSPVYYTTFAASKAATGKDANGYSIDGSNALTSSFMLTAATAAATVNVPRALPADVAAVVGQPSGAKHLGAWR